MMKITLDTIYSERNQEIALRKVVKKNANPGLDGMRADQLPEYWRRNGKFILQQIRKGTYTPTHCLFIQIPKPGKKEKRNILASTALDQMLQHCICLELEKYFTPGFHRNSYGFIQGRGVEQAIDQCLYYMNNGLTYVVDADIRKCFDNISHNIVRKELERAKINSQSINLIGMFLKNPGQRGNTIYPHTVGVAQGSCISPILTNVVLNRLDWYLEEQKIPFVRYADDLMLFLDSQDKAVSAKKATENYLEEVLELSLNQEKTRIIPAAEANYLGYRFMYNGERYILTISDKVKDKMRQKILHSIYVNAGDITRMLDATGEFNRGWLNYYGKADSTEMLAFLREIETEELHAICKVMRASGSDLQMVMRSILNSRNYVMLSEWYDELKERGVGYGSEIR